MGHYCLAFIFINIRDMLQYVCSLRITNIAMLGNLEIHFEFHVMNGFFFSFLGLDV